MHSDSVAAPLGPDLVVDVRDVHKKYRLFTSVGERIMEAVHPLRRTYHEPFWALKGVNLKVKRGETVGILGKNGSGKSTLLSIIAGVTRPTCGEVVSRGRVSALLELGTGFVPEFTGRQNAFFHCILQGLPKSEANRKVSEIERFADLGRFFDQPTYTYSTGMYLRLAFSAAVHVEPDVLIVDEALSVGDVFFVQKCMRFIRQYRELGTLMFVSHDVGTVISLCDRALWLENGACRLDGPAKEVCEEYLASQYGHSKRIETRSDVRASGSETEGGNRCDMRKVLQNEPGLRNDVEVFRFRDEIERFGNGGAQIVSVRLTDVDGRDLSWAVGGERVCLAIEALVNSHVERPIVGFFVKNRFGQTLFGDNTYLHYALDAVAVSGGDKLTATFEFVLPILPAGEYTIDAAVADGIASDHEQLDWVRDALALQSHTSSTSTGLVGIPDMKVGLRAIRNKDATRAV